MSQFGSIQQIGQVAFNPAAAPVETYTVPIAGQPLAGNNLQQIAEALAPMSPALNRLALAITEEGRQQAAMEGAGLDFSMVQLSKDIEANEKAFRDVIAQTGSPNAANPYFQIAARQAYGKAMARQYEGEVTTMLAQLQDPFNSPEYATATAELRKKYQDQLTSNLYSSSAFNLASQEIDGRMARRVFEAKSQNMEKFLVEQIGVDMGNNLQALGSFGKNPEAVDSIGKLADDLWRRGVDPSQSLLKAVGAYVNNPDVTEEMIDEMVAEIPDIRLGKATIAQNAVLMGQIAAMSEGAKRSKLDRKQREMERMAISVKHFNMVTLANSGWFTKLREPTTNLDTMAEEAVSIYQQAEKQAGRDPDAAMVEAIRKEAATAVTDEDTRRSQALSRDVTTQNSESTLLLQKMLNGELAPTDEHLRKLTPQDRVTLATFTNSQNEVQTYRDNAKKYDLGPLIQKVEGVVPDTAVEREWNDYVNEMMPKVLSDIESQSDVLASPSAKTAAVSAAFEKVRQDFEARFEKKYEGQMKRKEESDKAASELAQYLGEVRAGKTTADKNKIRELTLKMLSTKDNDAILDDAFLAPEREAIGRLVSEAGRGIVTAMRREQGMMTQQDDVEDALAAFDGFFPLKERHEFIDTLVGLPQPMRRERILQHVNDKLEQFMELRLRQQASQKVATDASEAIAFSQAFRAAKKTSEQAKIAEKFIGDRADRMAKDVADLGIPDRYLTNPQLMVESYKAGRNLKVAGGFMGFGVDGITPQTTLALYHQIMQAGHYSAQDIAGIAQGREDKHGMPYPPSINPFNVSFFSYLPKDGSVSVEQHLRESGIDAEMVRRAFPSIRTDADFDAWVRVQTDLMMAPDLMTEVRRPRVTHKKLMPPGPIDLRNVDP